jgi:hypothetical protein
MYSISKTDNGIEIEQTSRKYPLWCQYTCIWHEGRRFLYKMNILKYLKGNLSCSRQWRNKVCCTVQKHFIAQKIIQHVISCSECRDKKRKPPFRLWDSQCTYVKLALLCWFVEDKYLQQTK